MLIVCLQENPFILFFKLRWVYTCTMLSLCLGSLFKVFNPHQLDFERMRAAL